MSTLDVVIVGAGPAGIGMALTLSKLPGIRFAVLEANRIGESFEQWPAQTRFITPSFHSNPFGLADLNAVNELSSPAIFCGSEHPSGTQYASYLAFIAKAHDLPIVCNCKVEGVQPLSNPSLKGFALTTSMEPLHTRFLIWATGEFQFPDLQPFPGAQSCLHYARIADWKNCTNTKNGRQIVIGGYESGVDAAVNLIELGQAVRLLVRKSTWDPDGSYDPSLSLSPHSRQRLYTALDSGRLEIIFGVDVIRVTPQNTANQQVYSIHSADGRHWQTANAPVLGTGFLKGGGATQIADLWQWDAQGRIALTEHDESPMTPGLFLVGPQVRQEERIYCFIYKFRQRFARVAAHIAKQLPVDAQVLQTSAGSWGPFGNSDCCEGCQC